MSRRVVRVGWAAVCGVLLAGHACAAPAIAVDEAGDAQPLAAETSEAADSAQAAAQAQTAYQQALQALEQQQWTQAELLLERVLMFQPEHAEALLQLATLLAQRDRLETAQALIGMLLHDPRTPPEHRRHLQALLDGSYRQAAAALVGAAAPSAPASRTQILLSAGYTRNPLGTTSATQLTLTLPDGSVTLPLAAQAQGGGIATVALHHQKASGVELFAQVQSSTLAQARTSWRMAMGGPLGLQNHSWSMSAQRALDGTTRYGIGVVRALDGDTQLMASLFHDSALQRTDWLVRGQRSAVVANRWPVTAWGEYEHGRGSAPGAMRGGVQALMPLAPQWQLQGLMYGQRDTSGYSKLLQSNAARQLLTANIELEYRLPQPQWGGQAAVSAYFARRWSNLALFDWRDHGLRLSWLRQW